MPGRSSWPPILLLTPPDVPIATLEPTSETANGNFGYVPGSVMISADGSEDPAGGIVWIMDTANGEIHAYSTLSLSTELWNSGPGSIATVKFAVPTVANGQVFVGTQDSLEVFGLTGATTPAQAPTAPGESGRPGAIGLGRGAELDRQHGLAQLCHELCHSNIHRPRELLDGGQCRTGVDERHHYRVGADTRLITTSGSWGAIRPVRLARRMWQRP